MSGNEQFDYGKAVYANCANCGVVQIPSRVQFIILCPLCNGDLISNPSDSHSQRRCTDNREQSVIFQDNEDTENTHLVPLNEESAELDTLSLEHLSLSRDENASGLPLQERSEASLSQGKANTYSSKLSKTPTEGNDENGKNDVCQTCEELKWTHECLSCFIAVFKRGVLSGKNRSHIVYFIPREKFDLVYHKIAQNEAAAYEGTEIAVIDEKGSLFAYHPQMAIQSEVTIISEMDCGECFALVSPASTTIGVQHLLAKSEERLFPGACVKLVTTYVGEQNTLREDKVRMALLSGKARLVILIPTKVHHTPTDGLESQNYSVTGMPKLDRDALQSCHVDLIANIGDFTSLCAYLYQYNILTADDKAFLRSFPRPSDGIDHLLMMIPRKGNILDIFIRILQQSRENQEAAKRLVLKRLQLHRKTESK